MGHRWVWCSSESESENSDLQSLLSWHSSLDLEVGNWRDTEEVAMGKPEESSQETDSRLEFSDPLWEDDSEDLQKAERQYEDDSLLQFFSEITQLLEPLRVSCTDSAETLWDYSGSRKQDDEEDVRCQEETTRTVVSRTEESQQHVLTADEKEHFPGREDKTPEAPGEKALCEPDSQEINQDQNQDEGDSASTDLMLGSTSPANTQLMQLSWDNPMQHSHFKRTVLSIWKMIASHRCSGPFLKAVSEKQAPGYSEVVKRPMDLTSIKRGLAKGHIRSLAQFQCSLMLMFQNAIMYNAANHHVHRMALEMRREVLEQMQMLGEALLRSEHRPPLGHSGRGRRQGASMAREKQEEPAAEAAPEFSYREQLEHLNPIAQPLASRKLTRKLYKCIRKAAKHKQIRRGVKEVQKFINKGEKGITVLAGDTLPIDVYCHIPIMCEDRNLPYAYVPSKSDLGAAAGSKRPTCVILLKPHEEYQEAYDECLGEVEALPLPL